MGRPRVIIEEAGGRVSTFEGEPPSHGSSVLTTNGILLAQYAAHLKEAGLSGTQIGLIGMIGNVVSMACAFLWGYLSDRTGKPNILMGGGALGALLIAQLYPPVKLAGLHNQFIYFTLIGLVYSILFAAPVSLLRPVAPALSPALPRPDVVW